MKLSIFPEANPHPKSKAEKHTEAMKFSSPYLPQTIQINNDDELVEAVTTYAWSPFIFDGRRALENFVSCDFLIYDIDEGMTINECSAIVEAAGLCCLCLPSPSHTEENHRFRILLPLAGTITDLAVYEATWDKGAELFQVVDEQCKDGCRAYFGSTTQDGFWLSGELFAPVPRKASVKDDTLHTGTMLTVTEDINDLVEQIYGEKRNTIPEAVDHFIKNAHTGLTGTWINDLNRFVFSLSLTGIEDGVILEACELLAPNPLDKRDRYQIKRAIRDGRNA